MARLLATDEAPAEANNQRQTQSTTADDWHNRRKGERKRKRERERERVIGNEREKCWEVDDKEPSTKRDGHSRNNLDSSPVNWNRHPKTQSYNLSPRWSIISLSLSLSTLSVREMKRRKMNWIESQFIAKQSSIIWTRRIDFFQFSIWSLCVCVLFQWCRSLFCAASVTECSIDGFWILEAILARLPHKQPTVSLWSPSAQF